MSDLLLGLESNCVLCFISSLLLTKICIFFVQQIPADRKAEMVVTIDGNKDKESMG